MHTRTPSERATELEVNLHDRVRMPHLTPDLRLSRRSLFQLATITATFVGVTATEASAQIKISQAAVGYQDHPYGDRQCANCSHFQEPNQCQMVMGSISAQGWCRLFAPKSG